MLTVLICGVIGIAGYVSAENGEWLSVAICAGIILLLLFLKAAARDEAKAYCNMVEYWKNGGPSR